MIKKIKASLIAVFLGVSSILTGCSSQNEPNADNKEEHNSFHGSSFFSGVITGHLLNSFFNNSSTPAADAIRSSEPANTKNVSPVKNSTTTTTVTPPKATGNAIGGFGSTGARSAVS